MTIPLPLDIQPQWLNVVRRLQSVACKDNNGAMIITLTVLVDSNGHPRFWLEPSCKRIEPRKGMEEFLTMVSHDPPSP